MIKADLTAVFQGWKQLHIYTGIQTEIFQNSLMHLHIYSLCLANSITANTLFIFWKL